MITSCSCYRASYDPISVNQCWWSKKLIISHRVANLVFQCNFTLGLWDSEEVPFSRKKNWRKAFANTGQCWYQNTEQQGERDELGPQRFPTENPQRHAENTTSTEKKAPSSSSGTRLWFKKKSNWKSSNTTGWNSDPNHDTASTVLYRWM